MQAQSIQPRITLFDQLRILNADPSLSKGAFKLAAEIVIGAQSRGYVFHSIAAFMTATAQGERSIQLYLRELERLGYVVTEKRSRRTRQILSR